MGLVGQQGSVDGSVDGAGRDVVDCDAEWAEFHREVAHEHANAAFGCAVAGEVREHHVFVDRRDVDHAARLFGLGELLAELLGQEERGFQVGREDYVVVGFGGLQERCVLFDARIVDQDVAAAELCIRLIDEVLRVGEAGYVGLDDDAFAASGLDFGPGLFCAIGVAAKVDDDRRAFRAETDSDGLTDARR